MAAIAAGSLGLGSLGGGSFSGGTAQAQGPDPKLRQVQSLEFLGEVQFAGQSWLLDGVLLGGLSGLTYDPKANLFYSISDDRSENAPARFYRLQIQLRPDPSGSQGPDRESRRGKEEVGARDRLVAREQVRFLRSTPLQQPDQQPFEPNGVDPEGIALTPQGTLWISSEGIAPEGVAPFVREFSPEGAYLRSLPIPQRYRPRPDWGVGDNLGFESLTLSPSGQYLATAVENALVQDGPQASVGQSSPARLLVFDLATQMVAGEYLYNTDPVVAAPNPPDAFAAAGLVELLALDDQRFLALERMYAAGSTGMPGNNGMSVRLYEIDRRRATDIQSLKSLAEAGLTGSDLGRVVPVEKQLVLDLTTLGLPLSNLEGMTFGPLLADGRRSLILISDDNFGQGQFTQVLLFGVNE